jgi:hypothetical protein
VPSSYAGALAAQLNRWASMKRTAIAVCFAIASPTGSASDGSITRLSGRYEVQSHCSTLGPNGYEPCVPEVRDSLDLNWTSDTSATFDLYSVQANGHQCAVSGVASLRGDSLVFVDPKSPNQDQGVAIRLVAGVIRISYLTPQPSRDFRYCGTRATLNGIAFPIESRVHE